MKKIAILLTSLLLAFITSCQDHVFEPNPNNPPLEESAWLGGGPISYPHDLYRDKDGSVYVAGIYSNTATFGGVTLTGPESTNFINSFLVKYSSSGEVLWAQKIGGNGDNYFYRIAVDSHGNVYAAGKITHTATIGGTTINGRGFIVVKYSSQGEIQWIKLDETLNSDSEILAIAIDQSDNIYIAGSFRFNTTMVNGIRMTPRDSGIPRMTTHDFFIAKLNTSGEYQWVRQVGKSGIDVAVNMTTDKEGNFYITGIIAEANGAGNIAKYNPQGALQWITTLGIGNGWGQNVEVDEAGNVYVDTENSIGKINSSGTVQWFHQIPAVDIAANAQGEVFITGNFSGTANILGQTLTSSGGSDIYIAKLASDGTLKWIRRDGTASYEVASGITLSPEGNIFVVGQFHNTTTTLAGQTLSASGGSLFIARYKE
ncbi:SBBP repeat-containing protein [Telluribacter sp. SYSU D00476]|uniref:SBBP repeat-containing protein n=1 Tax=Telluribacter sp. SYSU D00476 TaxID=2811430 RepID=UPI001FF3F03E|nr:SBBP repeat-containing protein [Telluribacter sp. SYSU D00476]